MAPNDKPTVDRPGRASDRPHETVTEDSAQVQTWSEDHQLGRFRIVRKLGAGGMGVVYEAVDTERGGRIALKSLKSLAPQATRRFKNEFRALADLRHPNVIELYELHATEQGLYFTMRLVDGCDWLSWVRASGTPAGWSNDDSQVREGIDFDRLTAALRQLTLGVDAIHRAGKLHRDLKPANVLVERDGRVVLLDFGLVRSTDDAEPSSLTMSGAVIGTPAFMSPEQSAGQPLTTASDWYAVGVILFQALTNQLPFPDVPSLVRRASKPPPDPRELSPDIPAPLGDLCTALLAHDPEDRPDAAAILAVLPPGEAPPAPRAEHKPLPFVAREEALEQLREAYNDASLGRTVVVLIDGPSGIGKSSLADHFLRTQRRKDGRGVVILRGRCYEQESVPYKAFDPLMERLTSYLGQLPSAEAASLLPREIRALTRLFPSLLDVGVIDRAPRPSPTDQQELRQRAFDALRELLSRITDRHPLILAIDDLQWTDDDSMALLLHLLRGPDAPPVLLVASYRTEEAADASSPAMMRFLRAMDESRSHWSVRRTTLGPLPSAHATQLAEAMLGEHGLSSDLAGRIAAESEGNPLLVGELIQHLASAQAHGKPTPLESPRLLATLLQERTEGLPPTARRLLETVAVAGRRLALSVALAAAHASEGEEDPIVRLRAERFVRTAGPDDARTIETYHDRIRRTTVEQMSDDARRHAHQALADALQRADDPDPDHLLEHYRKAGDRQRAGMFAIRAAERAAAQLAFDRAAEHFELALELDAGDRAKLEARLAEALANAGRGRDAADAYLRAAELEDGRVRVDLQRRAAVLLLESGHSERGKAVMAKVLAAHSLELPARRGAVLAGILMRRAKLKLRGLSWKEAPHVDPDTLDRVDVCLSASRGLVISDLLAGGYFQAEHLLLALESGDPSRVALALSEEAKSASYFGERGVVRARALLSEVEALAERIGTKQARANAMTTEALVLLMGGQWANSLKLNREAEALLRDEWAGGHQEIFDVLARQAAALSVMGDMRGVDALCTRTAAEAGRRSNVYHEVQAQAFLVLPALARDDVEQAREILGAMTPLAAARELQAAAIQLLNVRTALDIYTGNEAEVWTTRNAEVAAMRSNPLMRASIARSEVWAWHGRLALAAAERKPDRSSTMIRCAKQQARALAKDAFPPSAPFASLLRAGIHNLQGNTQHTEAELREAAERFDTLDMRLYAGATRRRLGHLLGGERGALMCKRADAVLQDIGVKNLDAFTRIWVPGFA